MRIGITGTMSVGKTTLVNALKDIEQFKNYKFATERSKYLRDLGIPLNTDSTLKGQTIFLAERCSELINENLITDRTVVDVMAFTNLAKSINMNDKISFLDYSCRFMGEYDYIFYIPFENIEIENNGVRTTDPQYREEIDFTIQSILEKYSFLTNKVHLIQGTTEERISQILHFIQP